MSLWATCQLGQLESQSRPLHGTGIFLYQALNDVGILAFRPDRQKRRRRTEGIHPDLPEGRLGRAQIGRAHV